MEVKIKRVRNLGNGHVVELDNEEYKWKIMKNKSKLKEVNEPKVFINDGMNKTEREIQALIRSKAKEERAKGSDVKIRFQKVSINGAVWKWNKVKNTIEQPKN